MICAFLKAALVLVVCAADMILVLALVFGRAMGDGGSKGP
jgi:hypothetical protein